MCSCPHTHCLFTNGDGKQGRDSAWARGPWDLASSHHNLGRWHPRGGEGGEGGEGGPTAHAVSGALWSKGSFLPEGQRRLLPHFLISWPVHTSLTASVWAGDPAHPHFWTPVPCTPVGLWAQPLHRAQGQLEAWQPEATDPGAVVGLTADPPCSAGRASDQS